MRALIRYGDWIYRGGTIVFVMVSESVLLVKACVYMMGDLKIFVLDRACGYGTRYVVICLSVLIYPWISWFELYGSRDC